MRLKNKVAIITGTGTGIGKSVAMLFAAEGAKVVAASRRESNGQPVVDEIQGCWRRCGICKMRCFCRTGRNENC